jgi:nucleoside-diphosphate-sugar epimerase
MLKNEKILVTGGTGQVARPIAEFLAKDNEIWTTARFTDPAAKAEIEKRGIRTHFWTLGESDFSGLPDDFTYVVHSAASIFDVAHDYDAAIRMNAESAGLLMAHCRRAKGFLFVSSSQIYAPVPDSSVLRNEGDPLGSHPTYSPSYSIAKVASEAVVRTFCRHLGLPATIGRLGMAYGTSGHGGVPTIAFRAMLAGEPIKIAAGAPSYCSLIHEDDIVAQVEPLLRAASVPATIVNWCGDEGLDEVELYRYMAEISGIAPKLVPDPNGGYYGGVGDVTRRTAITGPCKVRWREGVLRTLRARFPDHAFEA